MTRSFRLAPLLIPACLLFSSGCGHIVERAVKSSATYTPWDFLVIDGDDGTPIADARVSAVADLADDVAGTTNRRGIVRLDVPTGVCEGVYVRKAGYMPSPSQHPEWEKLSGTIVIPLYREPPPRTGLIIPAGFRGEFRVREYLPTGHPTERPTSTAPALTHGRREFLIAIDPNGVVDLQRPPTMVDYGRHLVTYESRRPDGTPSKFQLDPIDILIYRFSDGTPLRLENPTMPVSSEKVFLPGVRDLVAPRADGVRLYRLGGWYEGVGGDPTSHTIYFVGTLEQATAAQRRRMTAGATTAHAAGAPQVSKFTPIPLVIPDPSSLR